MSDPKISPESSPEIDHKIDNKMEPSIYRYVLQHTKKDQFILLLLTLATMPVIYFTLEIPKIIINNAISGEGVPASILGFPTDQIQFLLFLCCLFIVLVLISGGLKYSANVYRGTVGERMLRRVRFDLYSRILRFPTPRFKQVSQAEILPMVTAETEPLGGFIGDAFALPAFQGGLLITYLFFIFNQDPWLGLAAIALYPPQLYLIPKLQAKVNNLSKKRVQAVRQLSDKIGESISGINDIHLNDTSHYEKAHVSDRLGKIYHIRFEIYKRKFFIKFLNNFLGQLTPFFFYSIGGYFVIKGELTLGALVAVLAAYKDLASPWKELLKFYQITEDIRVKYRQIIEQFQPPAMLAETLQEDQDGDFNFASADISGTNINYDEGMQIKSLDNLNFQLKGTNHIGIIGKGGSGRTDLVHLIVGLINPSAGKVKIADNNVAELSESILGRKVSYVDQQSFVFNGTVRENLIYGLKYRPTEEFAYDEENRSLRKKVVADAIASGNSSDDIQSEWIDYRAAGHSNHQELQNAIMLILESTGLKEDIYHLGLYTSVNPQQYPELIEGIISARERLRDVILNDEYGDLVEVLKEDKYNNSLSVAENLFFGVPKGVDVSYESMLGDANIRAACEQTGLTKSLLEIGQETAKTLVEIFIDVPDSSPLFERFSFVDAEQLLQLAQLSTTTDKEKLHELTATEQSLLMGLSLKLTVARHRLGLVTEEIQNQIIASHLFIKEKLGEDNDLIEFFDEKKITAQLSIQDNILFGRVVYGQANAQEKLSKLMEKLISELDLKQQILEVGLDFNVGVAGARLSSEQRQKLTIARALIKNPEILVVNEALSRFDASFANALKQQVLEIMKSKTVIWVVGNNETLDYFDNLIVLDKGKMVAQGSKAEIQPHYDALYG